jgi:hypothetical protein
MDDAGERIVVGATGTTESDASCAATGTTDRAGSLGASSEKCASSDSSASGSSAAASSSASALGRSRSCEAGGTVAVSTFGWRVARGALAGSLTLSITGGGLALTGKRSATCGGASVTTSSPRLAATVRRCATLHPCPQ